MGAHALPQVWLHFPPLCHCEASSVTNWLCVKAPNTHTHTHSVNRSLGNKAQKQPLFFFVLPPHSLSVCPPCGGHMGEGFVEDGGQCFGGLLRWQWRTVVNWQDSSSFLPSCALHNKHGFLVKGRCVNVCCVCLNMWKTLYVTEDFVDRAWWCISIWLRSSLCFLSLYTFVRFSLEGSEKEIGPFVLLIRWMKRREREMGLNYRQ